MVNKNENATSAQPGEGMSSTLDNGLGGLGLSNQGLMALVGILVVVPLLIWGGYGFYSYQQEKKAEKVSAAIFQFKKEGLSGFKEKKVQASDLLTQYEDMQKRTDHHPSTIQAAMETSTALAEAGEREKAVSILLPFVQKFDPETYVHFFAGSALAVHYEDMQKYPEAIGVLEKMKSSKTKLLQAKMLFDLGRLYQKTGQKDKAAENFKNVVESFPNDEWANLARLKLETLK